MVEAIGAASHEHAEHAHAEGLAHQFDDLDQQFQASELGMWMFLVTEVLFFGGLFLAYSVYRLQDEAIFAESSRRYMDVTLGAVNTAVLLCSSLSMALAVHAAHVGRRKTLMGLLVTTIVLGTIFLGVKAVEYHHKYVEHVIPLPRVGLMFHPEHPLPPGSEIFFTLYFVMTGLHAVHMVIGIVILAILWRKATTGGLLLRHYTPVHLTGLYWHFVDIVWVFLFPLLYLIGTSKGH